MKNTMKKPVAIPVEKLRPFDGHPFKVKDDEEMNTLIESIQTQGILSPLIVRPIENTEEYEVISGHRRLHAAQKAGITEVPALIYALDRDAAAIAVVDSNLHREHILPSEKAFAYKLKMEALSHQGKRTDLTSTQPVAKLRTADVVGEALNESRETVRRFIRLTYLIPEFLEKMDKGEIALSVGVELSFLDESSQREVLEQCAINDCFTVDFLTKKRKVNEGEVPQYYVEHSHEPIITPEEFDKVQTELARRKRISRQYSGKSIFSSRIVCGDCGSYFGSKVWNSTSKYRRVIWQCNGKFKGEHKCETPHLDEETIKARFVAALNAVIDSKDNILEDCRLMQATLTDCTGIDTEIESLLEEIEVVTELTKRCIAENSQTAQNQEEYAARYNGFVERYEKAKAQLEQLRTTKTAREAQAEAIGAFMFEMQELDTINEFDEKLWLTIIDTVTVHADGRMTFKFQGGTEIEA